MKKLIVLVSVMLAGMASVQANEFKRDQNRQTPGERILAGWVCDLDGNVGGIKLGVGPSAQVMAGYGQYSCTEYNLDGRKIGEYNERVKMAFLGGGIGIGLSVVESISVHSRGIRLGNINPQKFIGTRFGIDGGIDLDVIRRAARASVSVSLSDTNGLSFSLDLSQARAIGLYAGLNIRGFVIHHEGHEGIIVGGLNQIGNVFKTIFDQKNSGRAVFKAENVVESKEAARSRADAEFPSYRKFSFNLNKSTMSAYGVKSNKLSDMIEGAIRGAYNACQGDLETFYSSLDCKGDVCQSVYIRAVCR